MPSGVIRLYQNINVVVLSDWNHSAQGNSTQIRKLAAMPIVMSSSNAVLVIIWIIHTTTTQRYHIWIWNEVWVEMLIRVIVLDNRDNISNNVLIHAVKLKKLRFCQPKV